MIYRPILINCPRKAGNPNTQRRQREMDEKQLYQQRRVTRQLDVDPHLRLQDGHCKRRNGGIDQRRTQRGGDGDQPHLQW